MNYLTSLVKAGLTQPSPASTNRTDAFKLFSQGRIAMINASVFFPFNFEGLQRARLITA
jgi:multiple sugar transport system substrate-binding protein